MYQHCLRQYSKGNAFLYYVIQVCRSVSFPFSRAAEFPVLAISNGNRTEWSTIQGIIGRVISNQPSVQLEADSKLRARLSLNCTTRSLITN